MPGWATHVFTREFDAALNRLPAGIQTIVLAKITDMGRRLASFPHYRLTGREDYRLLVGDYRVIYQFDVAREEIQLIALGNRREIYR